jgi:hypothetical protein
VLANANCKLKICDFGLARVAFNDAPTTVFWTVSITLLFYLNTLPYITGLFYNTRSLLLDCFKFQLLVQSVTGIRNRLNCHVPSHYVMQQANSRWPNIILATRTVCHVMNLE